MTKVFGRLVKAAGLRQIRLHDLPHGAASLMVAGGADGDDVAKRLAHSSIRVTADTYSHLLEGAGRSAADAAEDLVRPRASRPAPTEANAKLVAASTAAPHARTELGKRTCAPPPSGETRRSVSQPDVHPKGFEPLTF